MNHAKPAIRILLRQWRLSALVFGVLAAGVGASAALFSFVNAVYFRGLAVAAPQEIVYIYRVFPNGNHGAIKSSVIDVLADRGRTLADFSGHAAWAGSVTVGTDLHDSRGEVVDSRYFSLLGLRPALGRLILPEDAAEDAPAVAVISNRFWKTRLADRPDVVGQVIALGDGTNAERHTVVGVLPPQFEGLSDPLAPSELWIPQRGVRTTRVVIARLHPGVSIERFRAFIDGATPVIQELVRAGAFHDLSGLNLDYEARNLKFAVFSANDVQMPFDPRVTVIPSKVLWGLAGAVALVLVVAILNVSGLLIARGVVRIPEFATRQALGASAAQLAGQLLTEAFALVLPAGVAGVLAGAMGIAAAPSLSAIPFGRPVVLDWRVLSFCLAICAVIALAISVAPVAQALRRSASFHRPDAGGGAKSARWLTWIVVPQVALAFVLLLVAGVHLATLARTDTRRIGYDFLKRELVQISVLPGPRNQDDSERTRWHQGLMETLARRAKDVPGVSGAGLVDRLPIRGYRNAPVMEAITKEGRSVTVPLIRASGAYFDAMGVPLVSGRSFETRDDGTDVMTVVISQSLARSLWPGQAAVGQHLSLRVSGSTSPGEPLEVIGVVGDVHPVLDVTSAAQPIAYLPVGRMASVRVITIVLQRAVLNAGDELAIRDALRGVDGIRVDSVRSAEAVAGELLAPRRYAAATLVGAGWTGVILASIGLFGLVSLSAARRRREIGVRAALGATPTELTWLVVRGGLSATAMGIAAGLPLAAIGLIMSSRLVPGLPIVDGRAALAAPIVLVGVVLAACYAPGRRAAKADPVAALRED